MISHDTMCVFEQQEPFDSRENSASSSSVPSTSDSNISDSLTDAEAVDPLATIENLKKKLKATRKDLDMALDASRVMRERATRSKEEAERLQERLGDYDSILSSMRTGHVTARDGVKVEVEDWDTIINKTVGRNDPIAFSPNCTANLAFLKQLTEDTENLTIEINRTRMIEKEHLLRIKALENTLQNTRQKNASDMANLFRTVEELQNKLTTAETFNESLKSAKQHSDDLTKELDALRMDRDARRIEELLKDQLRKEDQISQLIEEVNLVHCRDKVMEDLNQKHAATVGELTSKNKNLQNRVKIQEEAFNEEQEKLNSNYNRLHSDFKMLERAHKNMAKEHEKQLETQKKLVEKISRQNEGLEKQVAEMVKAETKSQKLMKGLREQNEDLVEKLSQRKDEIRDLNEKLQSQPSSSSSKAKLRLVSDSARNSPRLQGRQELSTKKVKQEEDVECLPDSEYDDVIVTKRVIPKRVRQLSSPAKSASKKLKM